MSNTKQYNWLWFLKVLTVERQKRFWSAIEASNKRHELSVKDNSHVYEQISNRGKSFDTREWGIGHIKHAFSGDEGARCREINNISGIELESAYFVYFRKIDDLDHLPTEPKRITQARYQPSLLNESMLENVEVKATPLEDLYPILAGYVANEGLIVRMYFIDADEGTARNWKELDSTFAYVPKEREVKQPPKPTFTLKTNIRKKDEA